MDDVATNSEYHEIFFQEKYFLVIAELECRAKLYKCSKNQISMCDIICRTNHILFAVLFFPERRAKHEWNQNKMVTYIWEYIYESGPLGWNHVENFEER